MTGTIHRWRGKVYDGDKLVAVKIIVSRSPNHAMQKLMGKFKDKTGRTWNIEPLKP